MITRILGMLKKTRRTDGPDCRWSDSCHCGSIDKRVCCEKCKWYWCIDSGYGYCRAMPEHIVVAWCRDICSLYVMKDKK